MTFTASLKAKLAAFWAHFTGLVEAPSYNNPGFYPAFLGYVIPPKPAQGVRPAGSKLARRASKGTVGKATLR